MTTRKSSSYQKQGSASNREGQGIWIVGADSVLLQRLGKLVEEVRGSVEYHNSDALLQDAFWETAQPGIELIVLDVGNDVVKGQEVIQRIKRARCTAPMVVLTCELTREFGARIISEGVRYYFSHDFSTEEFQGVVRSLLQPRK